MLLLVQESFPHYYHINTISQAKLWVLRSIKFYLFFHAFTSSNTTTQFLGNGGKKQKTKNLIAWEACRSTTAFFLSVIEQPFHHPLGVHTRLCAILERFYICTQRQSHSPHHTSTVWVKWDRKLMKQNVVHVVVHVVGNAIFLAKVEMNCVIFWHFIFIFIFAYQNTLCTKINIFLIWVLKVAGIITFIIGLDEHSCCATSSNTITYKL